MDCLPLGNKDTFFNHCVKQKLLARLQGKRGDGNASADATHYLMDGRGGGMLIVPDEQHEEFLNAYADGLTNDEVYYLIERRTSLFRWLADLDFVGPRTLGIDKVLEVVQCIQRVIKTFYPEAEQHPSHACLFDVVILTTDAMASSRVGSVGTTVKTGVHIVMPNLAVTEQQCLSMRLAIISTLENDVCELGEWNSWDDIVDKCVYTSNGLRVPGSHKSVKCKDCKNDRQLRKECGSCNMKGVLDGGRVYRPTAFVRQSGELDETSLASLRDSHDKMIGYLSIRLPYPPPTSPWVRPTGAPIYPEDSELPREGRHQGERRRSHLSREDRVGARRLNGQERISSNTSILKKVQHFLRTCINPLLFGRIQIRDIFLIKRNNTYTVTTRGYGSQTCMNLRDGGDHRNNTIYFKINNNGARQHCFCTCTAPDKLQNRRNGPCKDYVGSLHPLTSSLARLLFPDQTHLNPLPQHMGRITFAEDPREYRGHLKYELNRKRAVLFPSVLEPET